MWPSIFTRKPVSLASKGHGTAPGQGFKGVGLAVGCVSAACDLVEGVCQVSTTSADWVNKQLASATQRNPNRLGRRFVGVCSLSCSAVRGISQEAVSILKVARMGMDLYKVR